MFLDGSGALEAQLTFEKMNELDSASRRIAFPAMALFSSHGTGELRFFVEAEAESGSAMLTIYEPKKPRSAEMYTLDATNGSEIPVGVFDRSGTFPWLKKMPQVPLPVMLVDERDQAIWKSGT